MSDRLDEFVVYLMGYRPPGIVFTEETIETMMAEADFVFTRANGTEVPIGSVIKLTEDLAPEATGGNVPPLGSVLLCIGHRHRGKLIIMRLLSAPS